MGRVFFSKIGIISQREEKNIGKHHEYELSILPQSTILGKGGLN